MKTTGNLTIENTQKTPLIKCDLDTGKLIIQGNCVPEDGTAFFLPVMNWIRSYVQNPFSTTEFRIDLHYFNTTSARLLLNLLTDIVKVQEKGSELSIIWMYDEDDDDIKESGEDYAQILNHEIIFQSKVV